jgi:transcriptional regulator with XRE-family HTH domain
MRDEYAGEPERILAARVREIREKLGMTQAAVARDMTALGLSMRQSTIAKIEAGQRPVYLNEAVRLAAVLRTELDDLITDPRQRGMEDALNAAREAERDLLGRLLQAQHALTQRRAALDAAQKAFSDSAGQVRELEDLHMQAQYRTGVLAAARDERK